LGYDPEKHHRRSIRLKGYDYTLPGAYFVTLLTHRKKCLFCEIHKGEAVHSDVGIKVLECWLRIPVNFKDAELDEYVLMPNHLHGIIFINESGGKGKAFANSDSDLDVLTSTNALPLRQV
jgi:putative transposase